MLPGMSAPLVVLTEASADLDPERSDADITAQTREALKHGCEVHFLEAEQAIEPGAPVVPTLQAGPSREGLWLGRIPTPAHYQRVFDEAATHGVRLLNTPAQHLAALELSRSLEVLGELTPESVVLRDPADLDAAVARLGFPLFVKGGVLSRKAWGYRSCVPESMDALRTLVRRLFGMHHFARDTVVLRRLVPLRKTGRELEGFPLAREYRVFAAQGEPLAMGFYWPFGDPFGAVELAEVEPLVREAARRVGTPMMTIDVGQLEDGRWLVIEPGDWQFAGLGSIDASALWQALVAKRRDAPQASDLVAIS